MCIWTLTGLWQVVLKGKHLIPERLDPSNISYRIDGKQVDLINGRSEKEAAPGSV